MLDRWQNWPGYFWWCGINREPGGPGASWVRVVVCGVGGIVRQQRRQETISIKSRVSINKNGSQNGYPKGSDFVLGSRFMILSAKNNP